ncbi:MAG TPA: MaoC/PaaZ C-terminal domain-containing protein [bacterium]|nr:MaoC/PaaZ C-terminal domain-containing protein [bacterium]
MEFDKINVGDEITVSKNKVGKYQPILYAGAGGDFNPIHIDPEFGKMVGLGGNILHGLCTMAFAGKACTDYAGDPGALKRLKVRFAKPVKPLETVEVKGKIIKIDEDVAVAEISADTNGGNVQVLTNGIAEFRKT